MKQLTMLECAKVIGGSNSSTQSFSFVAGVMDVISLAGGIAGLYGAFASIQPLTQYSTERDFIECEQNNMKRGFIIGVCGAVIAIFVTEVYSWFES